MGLGHSRLKVYNTLFRIDPGCQVVEHKASGIGQDLPDIRLAPFCSQNVQVGDNDDRFILILELDPGADASHPVTQVQSACRAVAGEDSFRPLRAAL